MRYDEIPKNVGKLLTSDFSRNIIIIAWGAIKNQAPIIQRTSENYLVVGTPNNIGFPLYCQAKLIIWRWNMALKEARKRAGLTARDVANALGFSLQNVYNWESGSYLPKTKHLTEIANLYGCTVDELLAKEPSQK